MLNKRFIGKLLSSTSAVALVSPVLALSFLTQGPLDSRITYSRPSLATMFDSTGKLTYAPNNLLTYSNTFSNAAWVKNTCSVSGSVVTLSAGMAPKHIGQGGGSAIANIIVWFDVLAGTHSLFQLVNTGDAQAFANFNGSTGVAGTKGTNTPASGSVDLGGGIYRLYAVFKAGALSATNRIYAVDSTSAIYAATTSSTGDFTLLGSGCSAVTYETAPRSGDLVTTTASAYYGHRIDHDPATLVPKGLLIEEARTNLALRSQEFDNIAWSKSNSSVSANSTAAPDGTDTADTLTASAVTASPILYLSSVAVSSGTTYALSFFVKKGTRRYVAASFQGGAAGHYVTAVFDLDDGLTTATETSVGATSGTITSTKKENLGNGWYRIIVVGSMAQTSSFPWVGHAPTATGNTFNSTGQISGTYAGTETFYVWGAQLEAGAFATSHIPTGASSVARSADVPSVTGTNFSSVWGAANTIVADWTPSTVASSAAMAMSVTDGGVSNLHQMYGGLTTLQNSCAVAGVTQYALQFLSALATNTRIQVALAVKQDDFAACVNGGAVSTDTSGTTPTVTQLCIGHRNGLSQLNGWIRSISLYNTRLSNTQLQTLTTPDANTLGWSSDTLEWGSGNSLAWG